MIQNPNLKLFTILTLVALFAPFCLAHAQTAPVAKNHQFKELSTYTAFLEKTAADYTTTLNKPIQKQYSQTITEKNKGLTKELAESAFLFDDEVYPYLKAIFDHIVEQNKLDKAQFHFFVDRSTVVNAYSFEDGTIVCNLGLLTTAQTEAQLAMVLCHELSHYLQKHVNQSLVGQLQRFNSPELNKQVKAIKRQNYLVNKQLETLMVTEVFNRRKHNRGQERAADSLAAVLFSKTGYSAANVSRVFDLLEASDNPTATSVLKNFFEAEAIDADQQWFQAAKKMSFGVVNKQVADSLRTHPDCKERKASMQSWFNQHPKNGADFLIADSATLSAIKTAAIFDAAAFLNAKDNQAHYLYKLIVLDKFQPANSYIKSEIFNTLLSLCRHQKGHTLHTVLKAQYLPESEKEQYSQLLKIMDSVDLDGLINIVKKYYQNNKALISVPTQQLETFSQLKN